MKEYHSSRPPKMLDLGNGKTRIYFNTLEITKEGETHYESNYIDIEGVVLYDKVVAAIIGAYYSTSDELAILRQREAKAEEYREYYDRCESCKSIARSICGISET